MDHRESEGRKAPGLHPVPALLGAVELAAEAELRCRHQIGASVSFSALSRQFWNLFVPWVVNKCKQPLVRARGQFREAKTQRKTPPGGITLN